VVGTVIDPSLGDELKVTVVATGLDRAREPEMTLVQGNSNNSRKPDGSLNLDEIELPTILRRQREEALVDKPKQDAGAEGSGRKDDYGNLDIPTFLRRQAD
jgi:cell division protein FtsZ